MKNKKILISGMGVAGLSLALFLKRYGFTTTLLERSSSLRVGGYKVDIRGVALEVVKRMEILEELLKKQAVVTKAREIDAAGKVINEIQGSVYNALSGEDFEILRGTLCETILSQLSDMECLYHNSIAHIEQNTQGVSVTFEKGNNKERHFDLVIGADGLHSNVRRLVFGKEANYFKDLGLTISIYSMPNILGLYQEEILFEQVHRFINVYNAQQSDVLRVAFVFKAEKHKVNYQDIDAQMKCIRSVYTDMGWRTSELLSFMDKAKDFYFDNVAQIQMPQWSFDRVALVGDAGYCGSPLSGQGTSLALVGAYVLADELQQSKGDYLQAFSQYEARLRSFVEANQAMGRYTADSLLTGADHSFEFAHRQEMFAKAANAIKL